MARLSSSFLLLSTLLYLLAGASASSDRSTLRKRAAASKPLARRAESGYQPRHFRPVYDSESAEVSARFERRQLDTGGQIDPHGEDPQPVRGATGEPYLGPHNPAIDLQNLDGVAGPPTDSGEYISFPSHRLPLLTGSRKRSEPEVVVWFQQNPSSQSLSTH